MIKIGDLVSFRSGRVFEKQTDKNPIMIVIKYLDTSEAGELVEVYHSNRTYIYPSYLLERLN